MKYLDDIPKVNERSYAPSILICFLLIILILLLCFFFDSQDDITELNIPTGVPLIYYLDKNLKPIKGKYAMAPLSGDYLGDQEEIKNRIQGVKNQTK